MPERSALTETTQIGVETVLGTAVAATRRLAAADISLAISTEADEFRPSGQKFTTLVTQLKEWTEGDIEGRLTYDELVYLLSANVGTATVAATTPAGGFLWTFSPNVTDADAVKGLTVEVGATSSAVRAHRAPYVLVTELGWKIERDGAPEISGSVMGQRLEDGITPTAGATVVTGGPVPVQVGTVCVFMDTAAPTNAAMATKLTRVRSVEWSYGDRFNPVWVLDCQVPGFVAHVEAEPSAEFKVTMEADAQGMGLLTLLRAGDTRYFRVEATGPQIAAGPPIVNHLFRFDVGVKLTDVGSFDDDDGLVVIEWTGVPTPTAAWPAGPFRYQLTNTLAAL